MKKLLFIFAIGLTFTACFSGNEAEKKGAHSLMMARQHLAEKNYNAARDSILSLRQHNPTALQARAAAILLLDSIEMLAAKDSAQYATGEDIERLQIKAQFFERKLLEDQAKANER